MKLLWHAALVLALTAPLIAQEREREVPKDSSRVSIRGCARDRILIVGPRSEDDPGTLEIQPGRRFRLSGPKHLLDEIRRQRTTMVMVTGLVRRSDVSGPGGVSIFGGRVRIGGGTPQAGTSDPRRDPAYNQAVLDVESWRSLPDDCPGR